VLGDGCCFAGIGRAVRSCWVFLAKPSPPPAPPLISLAPKHCLEVMDSRHRHSALLQGYLEAFVAERLSRGEESLFEWQEFESFLNSSQDDLPGFPRRYLQEWEVEFFSKEDLERYKVVIKEGFLYWKSTGEPVTLPDEPPEHTEQVANRLKWMEARREAIDLSDIEGIRALDLESLTPALLRLATDNPSADNEDWEKAKAHDCGEHMKYDKVSEAKGIYLLTESGDLLVARKERGLLQHTSLSGGRAVMMAGGIDVEKGRIKRITAHSGHYRPALVNMKFMGHWLREHGVFVSTDQMEFVKNKDPANVEKKEKPKDGRVTVICDALFRKWRDESGLHLSAAAAYALDELGSSTAASEVSKNPIKDGTAFSFFTRNFVPLAKDLMGSLEGTNAWVDPDLLELVQDEDADSVDPPPHGEGEGLGKKKLQEKQRQRKRRRQQAQAAFLAAVLENRSAPTTSEDAERFVFDGASDDISREADGTPGSGLQIRPRKRARASSCAWKTFSQSQRATEQRRSP